MAQTFTGLKLQGSLGRFGKTATTDIEGYVEFPDGKVSTNTGLHMFSSDIHIWKYIYILKCILVL